MYNPAQTYHPVVTGWSDLAAQDCSMAACCVLGCMLRCDMEWLQQQHPPHHGRTTGSAAGHGSVTAAWGAAAPTHNPGSGSALLPLPAIPTDCREEIGTHLHA